MVSFRKVRFYKSQIKKNVVDRIWFDFCVLVGTSIGVICTVANFVTKGVVTEIDKRDNQEMFCSSPQYPEHVLLFVQWQLVVLIWYDITQVDWEWDTEFHIEVVSTL